MVCFLVTLYLPFGILHVPPCLVQNTSGPKPPHPRMWTFSNINHTLVFQTPPSSGRTGEGLLVHWEEQLYLYKGHPFLIWLGLKLTQQNVISAYQLVAREDVAWNPLKPVEEADTATTGGLPDMCSRAFKNVMTVLCPTAEGTGSKALLPPILPPLSAWIKVGTAVVTCMGRWALIDQQKLMHGSVLQLKTKVQWIVGSPEPWTHSQYKWESTQISMATPFWKANFVQSWKRNAL